MMPKQLLGTFLLTSFLLSGCVTWSQQQFVGAGDFVLAERDAPDGAREQYRIESDGELHVRTDRERQRPFLGLQVVELDKGRAEPRGVQPYSGLLVTGTYPDSAAAAAGALANDVVLAIGETPVVYLEQLAKAEAGLLPGQDVVVRLLRGQEEVVLTMGVRMLTETVTDRDTVLLVSAPPTAHPHAGVVLKGIPRTWCEKIFGEPREALVIASVEVGSPAWLAGIRGGDVIDEVDGQPVPDVQEMSRRLQELGEQERTTVWHVRRGMGESFEARIPLSDYSGEGHFWLPFVCRVTDGVAEDVFRLGPFGLLMNNRNHYVADSTTRRPMTRNVFNALFGLIHVDAGPRETEVRLLWFIRFDT